MQETDAPPPAADAEPLAPVGQRFTVADGFRFGCGFSMALFAAVFALLILVVLAFLLALLAGLPMPPLVGR